MLIHKQYHWKLALLSGVTDKLTGVEVVAVVAKVSIFVKTVDEVFMISFFDFRFKFLKYVTKSLRF